MYLDYILVVINDERRIPFRKGNNSTIERWKEMGTVTRSDYGGDMGLFNN